MDFLLLTLSIFTVSQLADLWIEAPTWVFTLAKVAIAAGGLWLVGENPGWCLGVAGLVTVTEVTVALLVALGDDARIRVLRQSRGR